MTSLLFDFHLHRSFLFQVRNFSERTKPNWVFFRCWLRGAICWRLFFPCILRLTFKFLNCHYRRLISTYLSHSFRYPPKQRTTALSLFEFVLDHSLQIVCPGTFWNDRFRDHRPQTLWHLVVVQDGRVLKYWCWCLLHYICKLQTTLGKDLMQFLLLLETRSQIWQI